MPVTESVNPPWTAKSTIGLVGSACKVMVSVGPVGAPVAGAMPVGFTGPTEELSSYKLALQCGVGVRPTAPSTWTCLPTMIESKTSVAPGSMVLPMASLPPSGANSSSAVLTWTASTTDCGTEFPPGTSLTTAKGLSATTSGLGPTIETSTTGLSTSSARFSENIAPVIMPIAFAQSEGSTRFLIWKDTVGTGKPSVSALTFTPIWPATSSTDRPGIPNASVHGPLTAARSKPMETDTEPSIRPREPLSVTSTWEPVDPSYSGGSTR